MLGSRCFDRTKHLWLSYCYIFYLQLNCFILSGCCDILVYCHWISSNQLSLLWCGSISDWVSHLGRHHLFDPCVLLWLDASEGSPSGVSATWGMLGPRVWNLYFLYILYLLYILVYLICCKLVSVSNCGVWIVWFDPIVIFLVTNHPSNIVDPISPTLGTSL